MDRVTITAAAARLASTSFDLNVTLAQEGPVGSVSFCNNGFLVSTGFWSFLGNYPPPVGLSVRLNEFDPDSIDLTWSGSAASFDVYRAEAPESIVDVLNLLTTAGECAAKDTPPGDRQVLYYLVVPNDE